MKKYKKMVKKNRKNNCDGYSEKRSAAENYTKQSVKSAQKPMSAMQKDEIGNNGWADADARCKKRKLTTEERKLKSKKRKHMMNKLRISRSFNCRDIIELSKSSATLNLKYNNEDFIEKFKAVWKMEAPSILSGNDKLEVSAEPFKYSYLTNLLESTEILYKIMKELESLEIVQKNNDMYKFKQTESLMSCKQPHICALRTFMKGPLREWLIKVTGINLYDTLEMSSSMYDYSDNLLCHDDRLENRRIAYVLYLVPSWTEKDGGSLDLFSMGDYDRPKSIVKRIYPEMNAFVFFEVSSTSFHQVAEVLSRDKTRLSINGWFLGDKIIPKDFLYHERVWRFTQPGTIEKSLFFDWINPMYLNEETQLKIRKEFEEKSEMQLNNFLESSKYEELCKVLCSPIMLWQWKGPPNKRHYEVAKEESQPDIVKEFKLLLQSEAMFLVLSQLTGLQLHHLAPKDDDSEEEEDESEDEEDVKAKRDWYKDEEDIEYDDDGQMNGSTLEKNSGDEKDVSDNPRTSTEKVQIKYAAVDRDSVIVHEDWLNESKSDYTKRTKTKVIKCINKEPVVHTQLQRWKWGSYTMLKDTDFEAKHKYALDSYLFCNASIEWQPQFGGCITYIAKNEEEEILTVVPQPNALALVYRDRLTSKFTKCINVQSQSLGESSRYHQFYSEYLENESYKM